MTPREVIGVAEVPGGEPLRLVRHGRDFIIMLERNELMSSRMSGSEEALAEMTLDRLSDPASARLLIGGYGMGFTLRAALKRLGPKGWACVVELVPGIIEWARGPMAELADGCLDDPRTQLVMGDVGAEIARSRGSWEAILLDVDNGPDGLTRDANNGLYTMRGLERARTALAPGGVLAVWSAGPDPAFTRRMRDAGFAVEEVQVRARQNGKGPRHVIWFGTKR
ncbi:MULTISPECIES: spermidine synthase [unclassified Sphingomonas]|uniref:spermidine synthase n=1 Tax=unclassified Sphingomonas TaxID=196159 RepID=UPI0021507C48|nr:MULTISPECIES: spermidine synthase [unclassified Sphingomonas]MCR5870604.1 spermidine synthase [Sphingomonas sp. J344]UUY01051.1 spermidine synthase [Sphingomonas sp. J315]